MRVALEHVQDTWKRPLFFSPNKWNIVATLVRTLSNVCYRFGSSFDSTIANQLGCSLDSSDRVMSRRVKMEQQSDGDKESSGPANIELESLPPAEIPDLLFGLEQLTGEAAAVKATSSAACDPHTIDDAPAQSARQMTDVQVDETSPPPTKVKMEGHVGESPDAAKGTRVFLRFIVPFG